LLLEDFVLLSKSGIRKQSSDMSSFGEF